MNKKITEVRFYPDSRYPSITIYRRHEGHTYIRRKDIDRILTVLNRGKYTATVELYDRTTTVHLITYKPMRLREDQYWELLRYAWNFINDNIDGRLEDWKAADIICNILGAAMSPLKENRAFYLSELVRIYGPHWRDLYR